MSFENKFLEIFKVRVKQTVALIIAGVLCAGVFSGCSFVNMPEDTEDDGKVKVVTTIFPTYDFSRQIAGEYYADITMLLGPGEESHTYEPTPQDIITIQNADVFIYVGGESESWVDSILESVDKNSMEIINLMDCVEPVTEELIEGMEGVEEHDHYEEEETGDEAEDPEYDEHVWTSIDNAQVITQAITDALCSADKDNSLVYRGNCEKYLAELSNLKKKITAVVNSAQRKTIVFGDRFPVRYFADEFGLDYYAAFPGCAEQSEPSAGTVAFLIEKVKEENIPVVFKLELSNGKIAQTIAESSNAQVETFNSCHNLTLDEFNSGVTYVDLMTQNAEILEKALN